MLLKHAVVVPVRNKFTSGFSLIIQLKNSASNTESNKTFRSTGFCEVDVATQGQIAGISVHTVTRED